MEEEAALATMEARLAMVLLRMAMQAVELAARVFLAAACYLQMHTLLLVLRVPLRAKP